MYLNETHLTCLPKIIIFKTSCLFQPSFLVNIFSMVRFFNVGKMKKIPRRCWSIWGKQNHKPQLQIFGHLIGVLESSHLLNRIQGANLSSFSNDKLIKFPAKRKRSNIRTFTVDKFLDILQRNINISIGYTSIFFSKNTKKNVFRTPGIVYPSGHVEHRPTLAEMQQKHATLVEK